MARLTVREYQRAVVLIDGRVATTLGPGRHRLPRRPWRGSRDVALVDLRRRLLLIAGQELATTDVPGLRITAVVSWRVVDPVAFLHESLDPVDVLRLAAQLALRDAVAARDLERLGTERTELAAELLAAVRERAAGVGAGIDGVELRDVTVPGELRRSLLGVHTARQDGLAALERARGETAALRALANGARLLAENPALLQLRTAEVAAAAGGTVVLGGPGVLGATLGLAGPSSVGGESRRAAD